MPTSNIIHNIYNDDDNACFGLKIFYFFYCKIFYYYVKKKKIVNICVMLIEFILMIFSLQLMHTYKKKLFTAAPF